MPDISDAELAKYKANEDSVKKLEEKNKELLAEKQAEKTARENAEKLAKDKETEALKAAGDYKTLAEQLAATNAENERKDKERSEKLARGAKLSKAQEELAKLGLDPKTNSHALRLIDIESIKYDEATNTVVGADSAAARIKLELPHLFVAADKERLSNDLPESVPAAEMTSEWFSNLSTKDQDKHYEAYMKANGYSVRR